MITRGEIERLIPRLRKQAESESAASKMIADARTERNNAAGGLSPGTPGYSWQATADTLSWKAADALQQLLGEGKAAHDNIRNAWAALQMIRDAIEELGPVGVLPSAESVVLKRGPEPVHEAEALVEGVRCLAEASVGVEGGLETTAEERATWRQMLSAGHWIADGKSMRLLNDIDRLLAEMHEKVRAERHVETASAELAKVRAALERIGAWKKFRLWDHEGDVLNFAHEGDATHLAHDNYEAGANAAIDTPAQIARDALSSLSEVAQSEAKAPPPTCFECGAPLIVMGSVCPICNQGLALASPSLRDVALEALTELAGYEQEYRLAHDTYGDSDMRSGRAWDRLRRAGDKARAVIRIASLKIPGHPSP